MTCQWLLVPLLGNPVGPLTASISSQASLRAPQHTAPNCVRAVSHNLGTHLRLA